MAYLGTKPGNGQVTTPQIADANVTTAKIADNAITTAKIAAGAVIPADMANGGAEFGWRNRIINGDMRIDQRNAGASVTPTNAAYTLDRWQAVLSQTSKFSVQQNAGAVTPPAGFTNYLGVTSLSSYTVGASELFNIVHNLEGFNVADFGWGAAGAQTVTLSFWVRSSLTGTFGVVLNNSGATRSYPASYTISAANTWEQKSITIPGDTSGTWLTNNGVGIQIRFGLGVGSTFSGTAGSWSGSSFYGTTGATSVVGTNGATWFITGVQLEAGSVATPFERRDYGRELIMCQRYYEKSFDIATAPANGVYSVGYMGYVCYADQWVFAIPTIPFKVTKRSTPTISFYGTSSNKWQLNDNSNNWIDQGATGTGFQAYVGTTTTGFSAGVHNNGNSGYAIGSSRMFRGDWVASSEL